jgi:hypothetical protein
VSSAAIAKYRLLWIVQADRLRQMGDHLPRLAMVWYMPEGFHF